MHSIAAVVSRLTLLIAIFLCVGLSACSTPVNAPAPILPSAEQSQSGMGQTEESAIGHAAFDFSVHVMPGAATWGGTDPKPQRGAGVTPQSYYGHADAGIGGMSILPFASPVTNLVAEHTIYHGNEGGFTAQLKLLSPTAAQIGDVLLYAPTMHAPNGACLEAGNAYYNGGAFTDYQTHMYVYAYDFCGGPGRTLHPDTTSGWYTSYVRKSLDGFPQYVVQLCNCIAPNVWSQRYYNFVSHRFDTFYTTEGVYNGFGRGGWTQFETQYNVQAGSVARCSPHLPPVEESLVRFYTPTGVVFLNTGDSALYQPEPGETSFSAYGTCFNYNITPASYRFTLPYFVRFVWRVVSTGY
jgi:hypothetical protein